MKDVLLQIKQRTEKLIEEFDKLEELEFDYSVMPIITDYSIIQDHFVYDCFIDIKEFKGDSIWV